MKRLTKKQRATLNNIRSGGEAIHHHGGHFNILRYHGLIQERNNGHVNVWEITIKGIEALTK